LANVNPFFALWRQNRGEQVGWPMDLKQNRLEPEEKLVVLLAIPKRHLLKNATGGAEPSVTWAELCSNVDRHRSVF